MHEFAHGLAAFRMGDDTAYLSGRLTLNPIAHVDPVGTLAVPALCYIMGLPLFGWAKPVPVNAMRLPSPRRDMGKVALAGPAMNLLLALILVLVLKILTFFPGFLSGGGAKTVLYVFQYGIFINVLLAVFNLMPIPPLDGGHIVSALLPFHAALKYQMMFGRYGMFIVIALIVTGVFKYVLFPPVNFILSLFNKFLSMASMSIWWK